jgi:hypothetical protein
VALTDGEPARRRGNLRIALVLASIALMFFIGIVIRYKFFA